MLYSDSLSSYILIDPPLYIFIYITMDVCLCICPIYLFISSRSQSFFVFFSILYWNHLGGFLQLPFSQINQLLFSYLPSLRMWQSPSDLRLLLLNLIWLYWFDICSLFCLRLTCFPFFNNSLKMSLCYNHPIASLLTKAISIFCFSLFHSFFLILFSE